MIQTKLLFCVKHFYEDEAYVGEEHSHPCYEIVYYCEGEGVVSFHNRQYKFEKDTFMVCPKEVKHIECGAKGTVVLYIGFELAEGVELPEGLFKNADYGILEYLEKIYYESKHWGPYSYELVNHFVAIIALKLVNFYQLDKEKVVGRNFDNIAGYIAANFQDDLSTKKLANIAGYSYDHFRKEFFRRFQMTVGDYVLQKRIAAANDMLRTKGYLIK